MLDLWLNQLKPWQSPDLLSAFATSLTFPHFHPDFPWQAMAAQSLLLHGTDATSSMAGLHGIHGLHGLGY